MDNNNNNDTDASPPARRRACPSLTSRSLQIFARAVADQSRRAWAGLLAFAWLFTGIYPALTPSGVSWQTPQARAGSVLYVNDAAGRLAAVIDPASNAAVYKYDAVGNILSINQYPATQVSIITVNPNNSTGTQAQICGTGFSTTLSQNTVSFNGVTGTVLSVSGACLIVAVPANATTGTVTLTTPSGSATSGSPYVVQPPAPTISGFTPAIGDPGTTVTVSGSSLNPVPGATTIGVGNSIIQPNSLTNTQAVFTIPTGVNSGSIRITTPYGSATSATDFIAAPSAIGAANIVASAQLTVNGNTQSLNISTSNKYGVFVFDAAAGQLLSLQLASLTTNPIGGSINYSVYSPANVRIISGSVSAAANMSIPLTIIPTTGTYLVTLGSGSSTVQLSATLKSATSLMANGSALSMATTIAAQSKQFSFTTIADQNLRLGITALTFSPSSVTYGITYIYKPDGNLLTWNYCYSANNGCNFNFRNLPTGTYSVLFMPRGAATMNFKATLVTDNAASVSIDVPYILNLRPSQEGRLSFTATAGQNLTLSVDGISAVPLTVYNPDGTTLASIIIPDTAGYTLPLPDLVAGTYTMVIGSSSSSNIPTIQVTLATVPVVTINGGTTTINTITRSQSGDFTFTATAGQNLRLGITALVFSPGFPYGTIYVYNPDGSSFNSTTTTCYMGELSCVVNLGNLPQTGTYSVSMSSRGGETVSFNATLTTAVTASLVVNTPYTLNLAQPGQEGRLTFTATSGQSLALSIADISTNNFVSLIVYRPDGTTLASNTGYTVNLPNLVAGTYTVDIFPYYPITATMQVMLRTGTVITTDNGTTSISTMATGQYGYFKFTATAGQNLGLGITALTFSPTSVYYGIASVYKPDGSYLTTTNCYSAPAYNGCTISLSNLQAGTYSVLLAPNGVATMSFNATLTTDVTASLSANTPYTLNLAQPGREGRLTFTATAGQYLALAVGDLSTTPTNQYVTLNVYKPDGTQLESVPARTGYTFNLPNLAAGTYTLTVIPAYAATTATMQVTLQTGTVVTTNGGTRSISTTATGQYGYFKFTATAGQNLGLGIGDLTFNPTSSGGSVSVYKPDGSQLFIGNQTVSMYCPSYYGCGISLLNLAQSGTYSVVVSQSGAATMNFKATLTTDVTASLVANTPYALNLAQPGQEGLATFSATAGQDVTIAVRGIATTPANQYVTFYVYKPDGTQLTNARTQTGTTFSLTNLAAGTYTVRIIPDYASTAALTLTLMSTHDGDLNADGIVNVADVALAERMALGLVTPTANQLLHGDVAPAGGNGVIDAADVARIRRKALGLENF